jgi:DNA-binding CsgD family transcriptional regulator
MSRREHSALNELRHEINSAREQIRPILSTVLPALRDLTGGEVALAFELQARNQQIEMGFAFADRLDVQRYRKDLNKILECGPGQFAFDPLLPERKQRNVALNLEQLAALGVELPGKAWKELAPRYGMVGRDQLRLLICDGEALLAFIAIMRPEPFGSREVASLNALVPDLHRRLVLERQLAEAPLAWALSRATLDAISTPAFVVDRLGHLVLANRSAQTLLEKNCASTRADLVAAICHPSPRYRVTSIDTPGLPRHWLVVATPPAGEIEMRLAAAATRWNLTRRQQEVLALVVRGTANKTIAVHLRCVEGTVELHVTALLQKSNSQNRAELTARFWSES